METHEGKDLIPTEVNVVNTDSKEQLATAFTQIQYRPVLLDETIDVEKGLSVPMGQITALGTAFKPVAQMFQSITQGVGGSGMYWVDVPSGSHLAFSQGKQAFIGATLSNANNQGFAQAALRPIAFDPTLLFVATVLVIIDKKLTAISDGQKEILAFLQQKEKAKQRGNLNFLNDVMANYKFNYNNAMYKSNNHIKVLDVRQESEQSILFYQEQLTTKLKKQSFIHLDKNVHDKLSQVKADLIEYRLALYLFAFSSFLDVLLLENYDSAFIDGVKNKILEYSAHYGKQYASCLEAIEKYSKTSVQAHVLKGLSVASSTVGKTVHKIPVIGDTQLDEKLIDTGTKLSNYDSKRTEKTVDGLSEDQDSGILPFIENITMINVFYNQPVRMLVDEENIYILN